MKCKFYICLFIVHLNLSCRPSYVLIWAECVILANCVMIGHVIAQIWRFIVIKMATIRHLAFLKHGNCYCRYNLEGEFASSRQISCWCDNPLPRYSHFSIFEDGGRPPCWIFKRSKFLLPVTFGGSICIIVPKCTLIRQSVAEIWPFSRYLKMASSAILDFGNYKFLQWDASTPLPTST